MREILKQNGPSSPHGTTSRAGDHALVIRRGRRPEPFIVDPATHPRSSVCLTVAADFLGLDERTVRDRIDRGELSAWRDGKVYRIALSDLVVYHERRRLAS